MGGLSLLRRVCRLHGGYFSLAGVFLNSPVGRRLSFDVPLVLFLCLAVSAYDSAPGLGPRCPILSPFRHSEIFLRSPPPPAPTQYWRLQAPSDCHYETDGGPYKKAMLPSAIKPRWSIFWWILLNTARSFMPQYYVVSNQQWQHRCVLTIIHPRETAPPPGIFAHRSPGISNPSLFPWLFAAAIPTKAGVPFPKRSFPDVQAAASLHVSSAVIPRLSYVNTTRPQSRPLLLSVASPIGISRKHPSVKKHSVRVSRRGFASSVAPGRVSSRSSRLSYHAESLSKILGMVKPGRHLLSLEAPLFSGNDMIAAGPVELSNFASADQLDAPPITPQADIESFAGSFEATHGAMARGRLENDFPVAAVKVFLQGSLHQVFRRRMAPSSIRCLAPDSCVSEALRPLSFVPSVSPVIASPPLVPQTRNTDVSQCGGNSTSARPSLCTKKEDRRLAPVPRATVGESSDLATRSFGRWRTISGDDLVSTRWEGRNSRSSNSGDISSGQARRQRTQSAPTSSTRFRPSETGRAVGATVVQQLPSLAKPVTRGGTLPTMHSNVRTQPPVVSYESYGRPSSSHVASNIGLGDQGVLNASVPTSYDNGLGSVVDLEGHSALAGPVAQVIPVLAQGRSARSRIVTVARNDIVYDDWAVAWGRDHAARATEVTVGNVIGNVGVRMNAEAREMGLSTGWGINHMIVTSNAVREEVGVGFIRGNYGVNVIRGNIDRSTDVEIVARATELTTIADVSDRDYGQRVKVRDLEVSVAHDFDEFVNQDPAEFATAVSLFYRTVGVSVETDVQDTKYAFQFGTRGYQFTAIRDFDERESAFVTNFGNGWQILMEGNFIDSMSEELWTKVGFGKFGRAYVSAGLGIGDDGIPQGSAELQSDDVGLMVDFRQKGGDRNFLYALTVGKFSYSWDSLVIPDNISLPGVLPSVDPITVAPMFVPQKLINSLNSRYSEMSSQE
eukprot:GHVT01018843.1.p1 GENE.GHVT01018843.1~~GHVT01018843.1.p1  ORF type:complete len:955 (+),score=52.30 GHVT01018843.1:1104-3968(+)